jgi:amidohydrolase
MACLTTLAQLLSARQDLWHGTLLALFQPGEETGDGAQGMVDDGLLRRIPAPDVALAQHVLPGIAGTASTRPGPIMTAADSIRVTVYGRGGHGSMPQKTVDPVVLAAMIIVRLQTVVSRLVTPGDTAVLTVGSVHAGSRANVIAGSAVLELNLRSYSAQTRQLMLDAVQRIIRAECQAAQSPRDPDFETEYTFPVTDNDPATTARVASAFTDQFGHNALELARQTVSEDFSKIPLAAGIPYSYWGLGLTDVQTYRAAEHDGTVDDIPGNHSPEFLPVLQPTLRTGTQTLAAATLAWLAR